MRTPPDRRRDIDNEEADAQLPNRSWVSAPSKITILIVVAALALGIFVASNIIIKSGAKKEERVDTRSANSGRPFHRADLAPTAGAITMPALEPAAAIDHLAPDTKTSAKPSPGSLFAYAAAENPSGAAATKAKDERGEKGDGQIEARDDDPLTNSLRASNTGKTAKAHILKHARLTIPRGTAIPCNLKTMIDTRRPGIVVCDSKEEVRGWGGTVMLLPRWTRFTGQISHGLTVDQEKVDVLWTSVLTPSPDSIEIDINSPATDMLGAPGVGLQIDNHVGEKIGAVLLYTAIEAGPALAVQALQNESRNGSFSPYSYNQVAQPSQEVAGRILERKLNRPPTGVKNQGEEIMIMVAQNWDLSDVISLEPVQ